MAGVLGGLKAASAAGGWFGESHENESRWSGSDVNLLLAKIGLDNGVHFPVPDLVSFCARNRRTFESDWYGAL